MCAQSAFLTEGCPVISFFKKSIHASYNSELKKSQDSPLRVESKDKDFIYEKFKNYLYIRFKSDLNKSLTKKEINIKLLESYSAVLEEIVNHYCSYEDEDCIIPYDKIPDLSTNAEKFYNILLNYFKSFIPDLGTTQIVMLITALNDSVKEPLNSHKSKFYYKEFIDLIKSNKLKAKQKEILAEQLNQLISLRKNKSEFNGKENFIRKLKEEGLEYLDEMFVTKEANKLKDFLVDDFQKNLSLDLHKREQYLFKEREKKQELEKEINLIKEFLLKQEKKKNIVNFQILVALIPLDIVAFVFISSYIAIAVISLSFVFAVYKVISDINKHYGNINKYKKKLKDLEKEFNVKIKYTEEPNVTPEKDKLISDSNDNKDAPLLDYKERNEQITKKNARDNYFVLEREKKPSIVLLEKLKIARVNFFLLEKDNPLLRTSGYKLALSKMSLLEKKYKEGSCFLEFNELLGCAVNDKLDKFKIAEQEISLSDLIKKNRSFNKTIEEVLYSAIEEAIKAEMLYYYQALDQVILKLRRDKSLDPNEVNLKVNFIDNFKKEQLLPYQLFLGQIKLPVSFVGNRVNFYEEEFAIKSFTTFENLTRDKLLSSVKDIERMFLQNKRFECEFLENSESDQDFHLQKAHQNMVARKHYNESVPGSIVVYDIAGSNIRSGKVKIELSKINFFNVIQKSLNDVKTESGLDLFQKELQRAESLQKSISANIKKLSKLPPNKQLEILNIKKILAKQLLQKEIYEKRGFSRKELHLYMKSYEERINEGLEALYKIYLSIKRDIDDCGKVSFQDKDESFSFFSVRTTNINKSLVQFSNQLYALYEQILDKENFLLESHIDTIRRSNLPAHLAQSEMEVLNLSIIEENFKKVKSKLSELKKNGIYFQSGLPYSLALAQNSFLNFTEQQKEFSAIFERLVIREATFTTENTMNIFLSKVNFVSENRKLEDIYYELDNLEGHKSEEYINFLTCLKSYLDLSKQYRKFIDSNFFNLENESCFLTNGKEEFEFNKLQFFKAHNNLLVNFKLLCKEFRNNFEEEYEDLSSDPDIDFISHLENIVKEISEAYEPDKFEESEELTIKSFRTQIDSLVNGCEIISRSKDNFLEKRNKISELKEKTKEVEGVLCNYLSISEFELSELDQDFINGLLEGKYQNFIEEQEKGGNLKSAINEYDFKSDEEIKAYYYRNIYLPKVCEILTICNEIKTTENYKGALFVSITICQLDSHIRKLQELELSIERFSSDIYILTKISNDDVFLEKLVSFALRELSAKYSTLSNEDLNEGYKKFVKEYLKQEIKNRIEENSNQDEEITVSEVLNDILRSAECNYSSLENYSQFVLEDLDHTSFKETLNQLENPDASQDLITDQYKKDSISEGDLLKAESDSKLSGSDKKLFSEDSNLEKLEDVDKIRMIKVFLCAYILECSKKIYDSKEHENKSEQEQEIEKELYDKLKFINSSETKFNLYNFIKNVFLEKLQELKEVLVIDSFDINLLEDDFKKLEVKEKKISSDISDDNLDLYASDFKDQSKVKPDILLEQVIEVKETYLSLLCLSLMLSSCRVRNNESFIYIFEEIGKVTNLDEEKSKIILESLMKDENQIIENKVLLYALYIKFGSFYLNNKEITDFFLKHIKDTDSEILNEISRNSSCILSNTQDICLGHVIKKDNFEDSEISVVSNFITSLLFEMRIEDKDVYFKIHKSMKEIYSRQDGIEAQNKEIEDLIFKTVSENLKSLQDNLEDNLNINTANGESGVKTDQDYEQKKLELFLDFNNEAETLLDRANYKDLVFRNETGAIDSITELKKEEIENISLYFKKVAFYIILEDLYNKGKIPNILNNSELGVIVERLRREELLNLELSDFKEVVLSEEKALFEKENLFEEENLVLTPDINILDFMEDISSFLKEVEEGSFDEDEKKESFRKEALYMKEMHSLFLILYSKYNDLLAEASKEKAEFFNEYKNRTLLTGITGKIGLLLGRAEKKFVLDKEFVAIKGLVSSSLGNTSLFFYETLDHTDELFKKIQNLFISVKAKACFTTNSEKEDFSKQFNKIEKVFSKDQKRERLLYDTLLKNINLFIVSIEKLEDVNNDDFKKERKDLFELVLSFTKQLAVLNESFLKEAAIKTVREIRDSLNKLEIQKHNVFHQDLYYEMTGLLNNNFHRKDQVKRGNENELRGSEEELYNFEKQKFINANARIEKNLARLNDLIVLSDEIIIKNIPKKENFLSGYDNDPDKKPKSEVPEELSVYDFLREEFKKDVWSRFGDEAYSCIFDLKEEEVKKSLDMNWSRKEKPRFFLRIDSFKNYFKRDNHSINLDNKKHYFTGNLVYIIKLVSLVDKSIDLIRSKAENLLLFSKEVDLQENHRNHKKIINLFCNLTDRFLSEDSVKNQRLEEIKQSFLNLLNLLNSHNDHDHDHDNDDDICSLIVEKAEKLLIFINSEYKISTETELSKLYELKAGEHGVDNILDFIKTQGLDGILRNDGTTKEYEELQGLEKKIHDMKHSGILKVIDLFFRKENSFLSRKSYFNLLQQNKAAVEKFQDEDFNLSPKKTCLLSESLGLVLKIKNNNISSLDFEDLEKILILEVIKSILNTKQDIEINGGNLNLFFQKFLTCFQRYIGNENDRAFLQSIHYLVEDSSLKSEFFEILGNSQKEEKADNSYLNLEKLEESLLNEVIVLVDKQEELRLSNITGNELENPADLQSLFQNKLMVLFSKHTELSENADNHIFSDNLMKLKKSLSDEAVKLMDRYDFNRESNIGNMFSIPEDIKHLLDKYKEDPDALKNRIFDMLSEYKKGFPPEEIKFIKDIEEVFKSNFRVDSTLDLNKLHGVFMLEALRSLLSVAINIKEERNKHYSFMKEVLDLLKEGKKGNEQIREKILDLRSSSILESSLFCYDFSLNFLKLEKLFEKYKDDSKTLTEEDTLDFSNILGALSGNSYREGHYLLKDYNAQKDFQDFIRVFSDKTTGLGLSM